MVTCPNCGYKQSRGDKCQKCASLFAYYLQTQLDGETAPKSVAGAAQKQPSASRNASAQGEKAPSSEGIPWRTAYRVARWVSLSLLVAMLLLIFHTPALPQVTLSVEAAARAEAKFSQAQAAAEANQPSLVTLDRTELNSYLNSHLQLPSNAQKTDAAAAPTALTDSAATPVVAVGTGASADPQAAPPANPSVAEVQSSVRDVTVDLAGDLVKAYVTFNFHGKDLLLELDGRLSSVNGYIQFQPVSGSLGSLPLPQATLDAAVNKLMASPENREKMRLPAGVSDIEVENGQLVIEYQ
jgi:uncharacterized protein YpmS